MEVIYPAAGWLVFSPRTGNPEALRVARDLDSNVEALLLAAAG